MYTTSTMAIGPNAAPWSTSVGHYYDEAEAKARKLLRANLSPQQWDDYCYRDSFTVRGGESGMQYEINRNALVSMVGVTTFCVTTHDQVPPADRALAMALNIEHDERTFLTTANPRTVSQKLKSIVQRVCGELPRSRARVQEINRIYRELI